MSIWGTTEDWAGSGPHVIGHLGREKCCDKGIMEWFGSRYGKPMQITDSDNGDLLDVWRCTECSRIWFKRPGMTGFFSIKPCSKDPMR